MPAASIALLNQKGGVGKTSTCHHLAGTLAAMGRRVLLIDNDPQSSPDPGALGPERGPGARPEPDDRRGLSPRGRAAQVVHPTGLEGIDLIPGSRYATEFNNALPHRASRDLQLALRDVVREASGRYDLILIDCPPNLHLASWAALVAAEFLVVPLQPEDYGAQGIIDVQESVGLVTAGPNPGLQLAGLPGHDVQRPEVDPQALRREPPGRVRRRRSSRRSCRTPPTSPRRSPTASRWPCTSRAGPPPRRCGRWPRRC